MLVIKRRDGIGVKQEIYCPITLGPFALAHGTHLRAYPHIHDGQTKVTVWQAQLSVRAQSTREDIRGTVTRSLRLSLLNIWNHPRAVARRMW